MTDVPEVCRLCRSARVVRLGRIPVSDFFAGRVLNEPLAGGHLFSCEECLSMFRHPVLSPETYEELYRLGAVDVWRSSSTRNDLRLIRSKITSRNESQTLLDVGCNSGEFLLSLPASIQRNGIEPSVAAAALASQAGIVIASSLEKLEPDAQYDLITIVDVVEHLPDALLFLDQAVKHLAPGGLLFVATGDPSNSLWRRLFRARFWYSAFPEHVTFPSVNVLDRWRRRHGLDVAKVERIHYESVPYWKAGLYFVQMIVYLVSPGLLNLIGRATEALRRRKKPRRRYFSPGGPGALMDHHILTFHRPAGPSPTRRTADQLKHSILEGLGATEG